MELLFGNKCSISFLLGHKFFHGFDILQSVKPIIDKTFLEHNISIDSALLDGNSLISLYRREVTNLLYFRLPLVMEDLHTRAMGKAVLAHLEQDDLESLLETIKYNKLTDTTITTRRELLADLEACRTRGYSINNEEYTKGLICIGAPLMRPCYRRKTRSALYSFLTKPEICWQQFAWHMWHTFVSRAVW